MAPRRRATSAGEEERDIKMIIGSACCPIIFYFYVREPTSPRSDEPAGTGVGGLERRRARSEQLLNRFHFLFLITAEHSISQNSSGVYHV